MMKSKFVLCFVVISFVIFGSCVVIAEDNYAELLRKAQMTKEAELLILEISVLPDRITKDMESGDYEAANMLIDKWNDNHDRLKVMADELGIEDYPEVVHLEKIDIDKIRGDVEEMTLEEMAAWTPDAEEGGRVPGIKDLTESIARDYKGTMVIFEKVLTLGGKKDSVVMKEKWNEYKLSSEGQPKLNVLIIYFEKEDFFSVAKLGSGKINKKIADGMSSRLKGAKTNEEIELKVVSAINYLAGEMEKAAKGWTDVFKNEEKEDLNTLIKIYEEMGTIDLPLVVGSYVKMEFDSYGGKKEFKTYEEFVKFRQEMLLGKVPKISKVSDSYEVKDAVYKELNLAVYNKDRSSLIDVFYNKAYQCRSITRAVVTTVLSTQPESVTKELLIIHTNGHTLPGFIEGGVLIGIEGTLKGNARVNFGKVNDDKSLEGQTEKVIAVKADHQLFLDVLAKKGGGEKIIDKLKKGGVVVNNNGATTSGKPVGEAVGGAGSSVGSGGGSHSDTFSFGLVDVPAGDRKTGTRNSEIKFYGSQGHYNNMGYGTGSGDGSGSGSGSGGEKTSVPLTEDKAGVTNAPVDNKDYTGYVYELSSVGVITEQENKLLIPDKEGRPANDFYRIAILKRIGGGSKVYYVSSKYLTNEKNYLAKVDHYDTAGKYLGSYVESAGKSYFKAEDLPLELIK